MIKLLEWDSKHFGFNIAAVEDPFSFNEMNIFCKERNVKLVQCLVDINCLSTIKKLEHNGFHFVDMRISLEKSEEFPHHNVRTNISVATNNDLEQLKEIGRESFKKSRFYTSPFKKEDTDRLYDIWLEKSLTGQFDDTCLVYRIDKAPVGFLTYRQDKNNITIGLFAVEKHCRAKKIGSNLLSHLLKVSSNNPGSIRVVTQGVNKPAINFYTKHGFKIKKIQSWYYKEIS